VEKQPGPSEAGENATVAQLRSWATALAGGDVRTREAAAEALDQAAKAGHQPLWALLQVTSPQVRRGAIYYWLDRFNPADSEAVAALSKGLSDQDPAVRAMAMSAAQRFPAEAVAQALPQLSVLLTNRQNSAETRAAAARLIGTLEAQAGEAAGALAQAAVGDPDASVRSAGLLSLCRAAPADQAAAVLQQVLARDAQASIRGVAAVRLGKLGPSAAGAAPALAEALADRDEGVRRKAADALAALGAAAVTPAVGKLEAADAGVRRLAVFVLGKLGTTAKPALDALRKRLQDPDAEVKQLAELAIRRIEGTERN
jgi:HEAT repeat protein